MQFINQAKINQRYFTNKHLENVLEQLNSTIFKTSVIGKSVQQKNIYKIEFGTGSFKVLLWSQMHGNETTTTKAVIDFLLQLNTTQNATWLNYFSFTFIPILNPDGAEVFTRVNANKVDLNRDSVNLTQPEAQLLRNTFNAINPDLALNMHDQRTIFSAGLTNNTATLSFLAPAFNNERTINATRTFAMQLIASMNAQLQKVVPNNIGRFDDGFNLNCIGDMFTYLNTPTILFEAGFFKNDYQRNVAQKLVFNSLNKLFNSLITKEYEQFTVANYLEIPENEKNFVDLVITNFTSTNPDFLNKTELPIVFKEKVIKGELHLQPEIDFESAPNYNYAHQHLNANKQPINNIEQLQNVLQSLMIL